MSFAIIGVFLHVFHSIYDNGWLWANQLGMFLAVPLLLMYKGKQGGFMTRLFNRKDSILFPLLLALFLILSACTASPSEDKVDSGDVDKGDLKSVSADPQETFDSIEPIDQTSPPEPKPYEGDLELSVIGATGFTSVQLELKDAANKDSETVQILEA
ncbi:hypothetical protein RhiirA1_485784, partial [Rhizophagus irregularis]